MPKKIYENAKQHREELIAALPDFARMYIRYFSISAQERSVYAYTYDLLAFFQFLITHNPIYKDRRTYEFKVAEMELLSPIDFDEFLASLRDDGNQASAQKRKLAALHGLFRYLKAREMIENDPTENVKIKNKIIEKEIVYLTEDESAAFLNYIKNREISDDDPKKLKSERERVRDVAIASLLLGTGLRVSELVGINLNDIDFSENRVFVWRKGGSQKHVYFSDTVADALHNYIDEREFIQPADADAEKALLLSSHRKRITTRTVENMICKYAQAVVPYKHITPHKLRSSFATAVLHNTGNIAVVSAALNHKSLSTTQKYYSKVLDDDLKQAAKNSPV